MKMVLIITVAKTLKRLQPDKAPPIKSDPPGAGLVTTGGRKTLQGSLPIQGGIQGGPIPTDTGLEMLCNFLRHHNSGNIFRNHHQKEILQTEILHKNSQKGEMYCEECQKGKIWSE